MTAVVALLEAPQQGNLSTAVPKSKLPRILSETKMPRRGILSTTAPEVKIMIHLILAKTAAAGKSISPQRDAPIWF